MWLLSALNNLISWDSSAGLSSLGLWLWHLLDTLIDARQRLLQSDTLSFVITENKIKIEFCTSPTQRLAW
jgi:hypothetical protein